jgi:hypothetical protein
LALKYAGLWYWYVKRLSAECPLQIFFGSPEVSMTPTNNRKKQRHFQSCPGEKLIKPFVPEYPKLGGARQQKQTDLK